MIHSDPLVPRAIGEPGSVPTAPAIANAIYDAVGVRIKDLPITPEKVLAALKEEEAKRIDVREHSVICDCICLIFSAYIAMAAHALCE